MNKIRVQLSDSASCSAWDSLRLPFLKQWKRTKFA